MEENNIVVEEENSVVEDTNVEEIKEEITEEVV